MVGEDVGVTLVEMSSSDPYPSIIRIGFLSVYEWEEEVGAKLERISRDIYFPRGK